VHLIDWCARATALRTQLSVQGIGRIPHIRLIWKASFDFDIRRFFKHASLLEINPILPSKTGGVLRMIGSASKHLQRDAPRRCMVEVEGQS